MTAILSRVSRFIDENPIKVFALIFISGDILYALNFFTGASYIWVIGTAFSAVAHIVNLVFGKGGDPNIPKIDYKISLASLSKDLLDIGLYSTKFFTIPFWRQLIKAHKQAPWSKLIIKLIRCFKFWKHPLDFSWVLIFFAGVFFVIDSANYYGFRDEASMLQVLIGLQICIASLVAFITDRNDLAGSMFATVTIWTLLTSVFELNLPFFLSGLVFLYGNYLLGKTDSRYQSNLMIDETQKK